MNVGSETKAVQYIREMATLKKEIKRLITVHDQKEKEVNWLKQEGGAIQGLHIKLENQIRQV